MMHPNTVTPQRVLADYMGPNTALAQRGADYGSFLTVKARPGIAGKLTLGYAATSKNLRRLKMKLQMLKDRRDQKVAAARLSGRKRRLKRRYARRIKRVMKRLARIDRVMRARVARRRGKGKSLTRRQRRLMALLKKEKSPPKRRQLQAAIQAEDADDIDLDAELAAADGDMDFNDEGDFVSDEPDADPFYLHPAFLVGVSVVLTGGVLYAVMRKKRGA
jgi:hypothetical protein